jgi:hypothetical protein
LSNKTEKQWLGHLANKSFAMSRIMMRTARNIKRLLFQNFLSAYDSSLRFLIRSISSWKAEINFRAALV